ncbi:MAG: adenylosuccinate lyase [Oscillospiraceae bacterium]|nr:adenylosuccinate lyase [Oscillospiraceae bacterium]
MTRTDIYESPFSTRYSSPEMLHIFSQDFKFRTFRRLWLALAKSEKELGVNITNEQIDELSAHLDDINYDVAERREKEVRHDVMAHIYAYGKLCPKAEKIIHYGATSCYVDDNTDIIVMKSALTLIRNKLISVIYNLSLFADEYKSLPCLAYTHLQPAQLTTVGKRATLWLNELLYDLKDVEYRINGLTLLGNKGATGTQASFMEIFNGDTEKVKRLEELIAKEMGFDKVISVSGQTYSRKIDFSVLSVLSSIAQSAHKFACDMRILQSFKEMEEPFEKNQIGSSAMPYKRNPMRSERICSLARYIICDVQNAAITSSQQWFERTLDDSANKRISVPEAFLAADAILDIYENITSGIVVYKKVIAQRVANELPFMAVENILMRAVKHGGDRQQLHERLREHSMAAGYKVKEEGIQNDLIDRIAADTAFGLDRSELDSLLDPTLYIGRSVEQVEEFISSDVNPAISKYPEILSDIKSGEIKTELKV